MPTRPAVSLINLLAISGLAALGCASNNSESCAGICSQLEICDSSTDELDCRETCEADQAYNVDFWATRNQCVQSLSCTEIGAAPELECIQDATREFPITEPAAKLCDTMGSTLVACDGDADSGAAVQLCRDGVRQYSDPFVDALKACYGRSCNDIDACLRGTAEHFLVTQMTAVFSPLNAPIATWTPANLFNRLDLAQAEACACSGRCAGTGTVPAPVMECYQQVYLANPQAYQVALDCHGAWARELEACNREATSAEEYGDCEQMGLAMTLDCPSYQGLLDACGTCSGGECGALPEFACE